MMAPDATTAGTWIISAAAVVTALVVLWRAALGLWRFARRVGYFLDDWNGSIARPGQSARPGAMERLASVETHMGRMCDRLGQVEEKVGAIDHEMHPNSGTSLRDAVNRIEARASRPPPTVQQTFITPPPDHQGDE